jgi:hypothetical protein
LSDGLNNAKEIKMKIKELLNDDDLYELWLLVTDGIWDVLMDNYSASDVKEGISYPRKTMIRANTPVRKVGPAMAAIRKPLLPVRKPTLTPKPKPTRSALQKKPIHKVTKQYSKIDVTKGPNFKLDSMNVFPQLTNKDIENEKRNRTNGR